MEFIITPPPNQHGCMELFILQPSYDGNRSNGNNNEDEKNQEQQKQEQNERRCNIQAVIRHHNG